MQEAREKPLADVGEIGNGRKDESRGNNVTSTDRGNATDYTLRRLARDNPELLDRIEAGELSVNAAAIQAGIIHAPAREVQGLKRFTSAKLRNGSKVDKAGNCFR